MMPLERSDGQLLFPRDIGLPVVIRMSTIDTLNTLVGNLCDMVVMSKQAHWNIKGSNFIAVHQLLDELWEDLNKYLDLIAERVVALGGLVRGTMGMAMSATSLECIGMLYDSPLVVNSIVTNLSSLSRMSLYYVDLLDKEGDKVTSNMLQELTEALDKWVWMFKSHIEDQVYENSGAVPTS